MKRLLSIFFTGLILGGGLAFAQADPFPEVNYNAYMGNMIVVAKVMENGVELTENVIIAAYAGDEIRGKASVSKGKASIYMMVCGDTSGEELHFAISTDGTTVQQLRQETFTYTYNGKLGTSKRPRVLVVNGFALADKEDNTDVLATHDGETCDVTLSGRTLYKDGAWNTLCLPFDVTLSGSILDGAKAYTLSSASIEGNTLTLNFGSPVQSLAAGVPYLIRWTKPDDYDADTDAYDLKEPDFPDVTVTNTSVPFDNGVTGEARVQFIGTYSPVVFNDEAEDILVVGAAGLFYPDGLATTQVNACRAYFKVGDIGSPAPVLRTVMNFGDDATGINATDDGRWTMGNEAEAVYDLSGREVHSPLGPGIYIRGGKKYIVKP